MSNVEFNAANNAIKQLFAEKTVQNVLTWRIWSKDYIQQTGDTSGNYNPIKFTPASVDTRNNQIRIIGNDIKVPDKTSMEIELPNGYESLFGICQFGVKVPTDTTITKNVYLQARLFNGVDYSTNTVLDKLTAYNVAAGMTQTMVIVDGKQAHKNDNTKFKLAIEAAYDPMFDWIQLALFVNMYGRQF